ncbi:MAG: hypothetical protein AAF211_26655 [Myxococcota bacterium]
MTQRPFLVIVALALGCPSEAPAPVDSAETAPDPVPAPSPPETGQPETPTADTSPPPIPASFVEIEGRVVFEAEHFDTQTDDAWTRWYAFTDGQPAPDVTCRTGVSCGGGNAPDCNQYSDCDPDDIDPADASGGTYLEALPDRRRDDSEPGTGGEIGVVNNPGRAAVLTYEIWVEQTGRYYVWVRARGQGPAANGLHIGLDGEWPRNDLVDPSTMRMQFRNGWRWTQTRRGGQQHTGVSATPEVSLRDANIWLDIDTPGLHTIAFAMREDGLEIDKALLTLDPDYEPDDLGPPETVPPR